VLRFLATWEMKGVEVLGYLRCEGYGGFGSLRLKGEGKLGNPQIE
jgi:hypothetical protein